MDQDKNNMVHYFFTAQILIQRNDDLLSLLFARATPFSDQAMGASASIIDSLQGRHLTSSLLQVGIRAYVAL